MSPALRGNIASRHKNMATEYICPHCGKSVYDDDALLCLYCGENLERGVGLLGKIKYPAHKIITVMLTVLVAAGLFLFLMR